MSWQFLAVFVIGFVYGNSNILTQCLATDDCDSNGDELQQFLSLCLKKSSHIKDVKSKLDQEDIDYDTLFKLPAYDIRAIFKEIGIKSLHIGLIIGTLYDIKGSGVQKYPSQTTSSSIVVLNNEQNNYILQLNKNTANVKRNIEKLEQNTIKIEEIAENIISEINQHYQQLFSILETQKTAILKKVEVIKTKKLDITKNETIMAGNALKCLQIASNNLTEIVNDEKLDIIEKQDAITQLIDVSQQLLLKYQVYLQDDMRMMTQPKMKYNTKSNTFFEGFVKNMNDILDLDIDLRNITVDDEKINIDWSTNLNVLGRDFKFNLQFKEIKVGDDNQEEYEWRVLHSLTGNQTEIYLNDGLFKLLKGFTEYQFRVEVEFVNNKIYSQTLNFKIKGFSSLKSSIITYTERHELLKWFPNGMSQRFKLLFRGSRDGFAASTFHQKCDDKGKTLIIVKSEMNHVFGGYTEKSWKHAGYKHDDKAWIYLLRSSKGDSPQKWIVKSPQYGIHAGSSYGPRFGGHDIHLADSCNINANSYSNLGHSYSAPTDKSKLAGSYNFKVVDYEVWQLI